MPAWLKNLDEKRPWPMPRKSSKMLEVERRQRRQLEELLPEMVTEHGITETAKRLRLSKATLNYWLLKLQIRVVRIALRPGESYEIRRVRE